MRELDHNEIEAVTGGLAFDYFCSGGMESLYAEAFGYSFTYTGFAGGGGGWGIAKGNEWIVQRVF